MLCRLNCAQVLAVALLLCGIPADADVTLPTVFGDHMVLQRDEAVPVWGWAEAGETVTVTFRDQSKSATADDNGDWRVNLEPLAVGDPGTLTVSGNNSVEFQDVLVGEVWVCSGQSNMQWTVNNAIDPDLEAASANFPDLRLFQVPLITATEPRDDVYQNDQRVQISWQACTPEAIPGFTAVGFFFGRQLHQTLNVPVGLIQTAWGGTRAEAWTSPEAMASTASLKPILETWAERSETWDPDKAEQQFQAALARWEERAVTARAAGRQAPRRPQRQGNPRLDRHHPSNLYNAMVAPLVPYAIRGGIWYQGESNASRAHQYRTLMPTMIKSWRDAWEQGDFPFYMVQLANFRAIQDQPVDSDWAELREAQSLTVDALPNVGVACITDLGAANDIHPKDKQNVGKRLARLALFHDYGMQTIVPQGPTYQSMEIQGEAITVRFETHDRPLIPWYRESLTGFAIAGDDHQWVWANAEISGADTVVVSHPDVPDPVAVRYNWSDNPQGNLYNAQYLPAYPFRSDDWPGVTESNVTP